jgi:crotonobetainyl-CoA:carnitine CoA-transferase CaiB-like acyl-CoA transferase
MTFLPDLTIVELSDGVAVRYCGKLFASHGARVVQVGNVPAAGRPEDNAYAAWLDAGKVRVADKAAVVASAHLVIAGQTPGEVVQAEHAVSGGTALLLGLTWFGLTGPYAEWRGSDALVQALSGVAYGFGKTDGPPTLPQGHAPQVLAGVTAFIAALAALRGRGVGHPTARIDVNVLEAALCFSEHAPAAASQGGARSSRRGINRFTPTYPQTIYPAADGWIGVTTLTPPQWQALCDLLDLPEVGRDPAYASSDQRLAAADQVDALLAPALLRRNAAEWLELGQARRIPLGPVPTMAELLATPHWKQRGSFSVFTGNGKARFEAPAMPFRFRHHAQGTAAADRILAPAEAAAPGPLNGLRVLDLSMGWSGPLAARHLADLGADIIKVEGTAHLDWWRGWDGPASGDPPPYELRANFNAVNRNKRGITLDLRSESGLALARRLAARADVVIENYAPGVLDRLGLSAAALAALNPGLVYVSMGAFGSSGPWAGFRAYGSTTEQASGLPFANGAADWPPCLQHVAYGDPVAGLYAAAAALIGLHARGRKGGAEIDLSQVECLFQLNAAAIIRQSVTGQAPPRTGSDRSGSWRTMVLACTGEDAWLAVDLANPADGAALARILDLPTGAAADAVADAVGMWVRARNAAEAAAFLQARGVLAAPVQPATSLLTDPQLAHGGFWLRAQRRFVGEHVLPASPYRLDGARAKLYRVAPTLGEHGGEVLASELDLPVSEIFRLQEQGVIGTRPRASG